MYYLANGVDYFLHHRGRNRRCKIDHTVTIFVLSYSIVFAWLVRPSSVALVGAYGEPVDRLIIEAAKQLVGNADYAQIMMTPHRFL